MTFLSPWTWFWLQHPFRYCYRHREEKNGCKGFSQCPLCIKEVDAMREADDAYEKRAFEEARRTPPSEINDDLIEDPDPKDRDGNHG